MLPFAIAHKFRLDRSLPGYYIFRCTFRCICCIISFLTLRCVRSRRQRSVRRSNGVASDNVPSRGIHIRGILRTEGMSTTPPKVPGRRACAIPKVVHSCDLVMRDGVGDRVALGKAEVYHIERIMRRYCTKQNRKKTCDKDEDKKAKRCRVRGMDQQKKPVCAIDLRIADPTK